MHNGLDGRCDCQANHYQTRAVILDRDFDELINALHDEAAEKELKKLKGSL